MSSRERLVSKSVVLIQILDMCLPNLEEFATHEYKQKLNLFKTASDKELERMQLKVLKNTSKEVADEGLSAQNELALQIDYILDVVFGLQTNKPLLKAIEKHINNVGN